MSGYTSALTVDRLPLIDLRGTPDEIARGIGEACRAHGFFYVVGHGIDESLGTRLEDLSHRFFALPATTKARYAMPLGGRAWRGWFPLGGELTSGRPDWKEGLYVGSELGEAHPRVVAGVPLHGANLIPGDDVLPGFRQAVLQWIDEVTALGHRVVAAIARSLDLPDDYFARRYTADPLILFRIFQYPSRPAPKDMDVRDGVGEHTDYGLLTLLRQDDVGGLQVRTADGWIEAPPVPESFVCNIGDMLDRMTGGLYKSTPHRVRLNTSGHDRLSFPLFFDAAFDARVEPIRSAQTDDHATRWDGASVHTFDGTYGEYLLGKIGKVFPDLKRSLL